MISSNIRIEERKDFWHLLDLTEEGRKDEYSFVS
jgi:hypothetical protein